MGKPTKATHKDVPTFANEQEERVFWESHDFSEHVDWSQARLATLRHLEPTPSEPSFAATGGQNLDLTP